MTIDNPDEMLHDKPYDGLPITTGATPDVANTRHDLLYGRMVSLITFPAHRPIRFHPNSADLARAFNDLITQESDDTTRRALLIAQRHMPTTRTAMSDGKLHLSRSHSGKTSSCTRTTCTCEAANAPTCWHRQAAAAIHTMFNSYQPRYRCPHCTGPMCDERMSNGMFCVGCLICRTIRYPSTVAGLWPWPSATTSDLEEAA